MDTPLGEVNVPSGDRDREITSQGSLVGGLEDVLGISSRHRDTELFAVVDGDGRSDTKDRVALGVFKSDVEIGFLVTVESGHLRIHRRGLRVNRR